MEQLRESAAKEVSRQHNAKLGYKYEVFTGLYFVSYVYIGLLSSTRVLRKLSSCS